MGFFFMFYIVGNRIISYFGSYPLRKTSPPAVAVSWDLDIRAFLDAETDRQNV